MKPLPNQSPEISVLAPCLSGGGAMGALAKSLFLTANANQAPFKIEYRLRRHDGEYRWVIDTAAPRFGEDGQFLGYIGSVTDIHERKQVEEAVQRSEQHLRDVINGLAAFIGVLTPTGTLLKANHPGLQAAGLQAEEVVGRSFYEGPWWSYDSAVQTRLRTAIVRAATGEHVRYNDLLDLAKIEAGKSEVRPTPFTVESLFSALRGMLRPSC